MLELLRRRRVYSDEIDPSAAMELYQESTVDEAAVDQPQRAIAGSDLELNVYYDGTTVEYELVAVDRPGDELYAMLRWTGNGERILKERETVVTGRLPDGYLEECLSADGTPDNGVSSVLDAAGDDTTRGRGDA